MIQLLNKGESGGDTSICQFDHGAGMDMEMEKQDNQSLGSKIDLRSDQDPTDKPSNPSANILLRQQPKRSTTMQNIDYQKLDNPCIRINRARQQRGKEEEEEEEEEVEEGQKQVLIAVAYQLLTGNLNLDNAPNSLEDAKKHADWWRWEEVMREEINTLRKMGMWRLVDLWQSGSQSHASGCLHSNKMTKETSSNIRHNL